jgi:hypothetical protein
MYKPDYYPSRFVHCPEIKVRFRDVDLFNHVMNEVNG